MAEAEHTREQHAKEQQQKNAEAKAKSVEEANSNKGKPTPTQEENDLAALGVPFETHEDDGSGPSPEYRLTVTRQSEPAKPAGGSYSTRSTAASKEHPVSGSKTP